MGKDRCTPGVYLIIGERGVRVGQSGCMETRVGRVERDHGMCIGEAKHVLRFPVADKKQRLALERDLIQALDPKCNIQGRRLRSTKKANG